MVEQGRASSSSINLNFREKETLDVFSKLLSGECCSVVGVGSVGKSNFLRHILTAQVQTEVVKRLSSERYPQDTERGALLTLILIDPNTMLDTSAQTTSRSPSCWAGYEVLMHRLYKAFYPLTGLEDREKEDFVKAYRLMTDSSNSLLPYIGLRYLERGLEILLNPESLPRSRRQIVFVFDEFEEMLAELPPKFFRALRGLRDDYKYRLMYLTFTRRPLAQIVQEKKYDYHALEPFIELFTDNICYLGPYSEADAMDMLNRLARRHGKDYTVQFRRFLIRVTGGHAGLLRASFRLVENLPHFSMPEEKAVQFLVEHPAVQTECQTIWAGLSEEEKTALRGVTTDRLDGISDTALRLLQEKKLLQLEGIVQITPPLFREFVRRNDMITL
jgi:hypothetical protein